MFQCLLAAVINCCKLISPFRGDSEGRSPSILHRLPVSKKSFPQGLFSAVWLLILGPRNRESQTADYYRTTEERMNQQIR